jgi:hypothetical protein
VDASSAEKEQVQEQYFSSHFFAEEFFFPSQLLPEGPKKSSRTRTMIPPVQTLVRYDNPAPILPISNGISNGKKGDVPKAAPVSQTEDILNAILKPRYATPVYACIRVLAT